MNGLRRGLLLVEQKEATMRETNPIKRFLKKPSLKNAVNAKCAECMGCSLGRLETGFQWAISTCSSHHCALHTFRPYQSLKSTPPRAKVGVEL